MKVIKILLAITLSFILLSGYAFAESVLPTSGKIVGSIEGQNLSRDIQVKEFGDGYVIVSVPIFKNQKEFWRVHASVGWTDGSSWEIVPMDSYLRDTTVIDAYAIARIALPKKGNGWFWVRIWGWNEDLQKWLMISEKSKYFRTDAEGKPGYEILVNPTAKKEQPVSASYDVRK